MGRIGIKSRKEIPAMPRALKTFIIEGSARMSPWKFVDADGESHAIEEIKLALR